MRVRDRTKLQIRLVLVPLRTEAGYDGGRNLPGMIERARAILQALEPSVAGDPELEAALAAALREVDALGRGSGEELIDPGQ